MAAHRQQQKLCLVALLALLLGSQSSTFVMLGSKARVPGRIAMSAFSAPRVALPDFSPLPWADDLEGQDALTHAEVMAAVDKTVDHMEEFDKQLVDGLSLDELHEYDHALVQLISDLEDKIASAQSEVFRNAMHVQSESQVVWLESVLQSIGDLRRQLRRVRDREGKLQHNLANKNRGFLKNIMRAAAIALGGPKAGPRNDYPATGARSFTGEPAETSF